MPARLLLAASLLCAAAPALAQERFPEIPADKQTAAERAAIEKVMSSPRKSMQGPFNAWIRNPELAMPLSGVGEYLRYQGKLAPRLREFIILATARYWDAQLEWHIHYPLAVQAGVDAAVLADLQAGRKPQGLKPDEQAAYDTLAEIRRDHRLSDASFAKAKSVLGEAALVEAVALAGYYDLVSMTLLMANVQPPGGAQPLPTLKDGGKAH